MAALSLAACGRSAPNAVEVRADLGLGAAAAFATGHGLPSRTPDLGAIVSDAGSPAPGKNTQSELHAASASRCEECHGKMADEWRRSLHARSGERPLYLAMRSKSGDAAACDRCHQPLASLVDQTDPTDQTEPTARPNPADRIAGEGVTCDVCHRIRAVEPRREGAGFVVEAVADVKYGPLCDAKDHYYHRMGCSPLHEESRFCAACHLWYRPLSSGGALPIYTEYEEWQAGPAAASGRECQSCHMPSTRGEVARGSKARTSVPHHGLLALDGKLRQRALSLTARVAATATGRATIEATVVNERAGHSVPSGAPERRVVLRVRGLDWHGVEVERKQVTYGRVLVDATGAEAPFYAATRLASDNRIAPGERRIEQLEVALGEHGSVAVELVWRAVSDAIAKAHGVAAPEEIVLGSVRLRAARSPAARTRHRAEKRP